MWSSVLLDAVDLSILEYLASIRTPILTAIPIALGVVGTSPVALKLLMILGLGVAAYWRAWRPLVAVVAAVAMARVAAGIAKGLVERPRPPDALVLLGGDGYAFPSTHAAFTSAAAAAFVAVIVWRSPRARRWVTGALAAFVVLVGLSMIYLGAHWATDVLAGWALGVPIGLLSGRLLRPRAGRTGQAGRGGGAPGGEDNDAPAENRGSIGGGGGGI